MKRTISVSKDTLIKTFELQLIKNSLTFELYLEIWTESII